MATLLNKTAIEKSTFAVVASFTDEAGDPVTPDSITWTLCDPDGNPINNRQDVPVAAPADTVTIVLSGADLQILDSSNDSEIRHLEISAVVDTSLGNDLPLKESAIFKVLNLKSIS